MQMDADPFADATGTSRAPLGRRPAPPVHYEEYLDDKQTDSDLASRMEPLGFHRVPPRQNFRDQRRGSEFSFSKSDDSRSYAAMSIYDPAETQFTLYTHNESPDGWKIVYILKALELTYTSIYLDFLTSEQKAPSYTKINPNGRIPSLVDKATGIQLWESGAIITYLVEKYDTDFSISAASPYDQIKQIQWLFFQASGQGPYFGQAAWFKLFHPTKIPSAIERYEKEVLRTLSVLEAVLSKEEWLNGDRATVADLCFVPWNILAFEKLVPEGSDLATEYPRTFTWHKKLIALPYVMKGMQDKEEVCQKSDVKLSSV